MRFKTGDFRAKRWGVGEYLVAPSLHWEPPLSRNAASNSKEQNTDHYAVAVANSWSISFPLPIHPISGEFAMTCRADAIAQVEGVRAALAARGIVGVSVAEDLALLPDAALILLLPLQSSNQNDLPGVPAQIEALAVSIGDQCARLRQNCSTGSAVRPIELIIPNKADVAVLRALSLLAPANIAPFVELREQRIPVPIPDREHLVSPANTRPVRRIAINREIVGAIRKLDEYQTVVVDGNISIHVPGLPEDARAWFSTSHSICGVVEYAQGEYRIDVAKPYAIYPGAPDPNKEAQLSLNLVEQRLPGS